MKKKKRIIIGVSLLAISFALVALLLITGTDSTQVTHTVKAGETAMRICSIHEVSLQDVMKANPDLDPRRLRVG